MTNAIQHNKVHYLSTFIIVAFVSLINLQGTNINSAHSLAHFVQNLHVLTFDTTQKEKDADFLVKAAEINLDEIMLGEQAHQKSKMADIRDFGEMLKDDHTKSLQELTSLANKKAVTIPKSADTGAQNAYKKFNNDSGQDFDIDYVDMMVAGHQKAVMLFESEAKASGDKDIRDWVTKTLPVLHKHLSGALALQKKYQK